MPEFENNLAIVIGINNYQNGIRSLQNAVNDATDIKKILEEKHKYQQVWQFSDEKATLKILNNFLENVLPRQVQPDDRLLFYFVNKIPAQLARLLRRAQNQSERSKKKPVQFLWNANPYLDVLREELNSDDNWLNQIEAEFVQESVLQKRQNISWRWRIANVVILGSVLFSAAIWLQLQQTQLREQAARVENLLESDPVEGLVLAIQTLGQNRSTPIANLSILPEVESSLLSAVQTARERNRFEQPIEPNRSEQAFEAFAGNVYSVTVSPDGQTIATAGDGGNVYLWDLQGNLKNTLKGNTQEIFQVIFSPDGETIIGIPNEANEPGKIQFWDLQGNLFDQPSVKNDLLNQYIDIISDARQSINQGQTLGQHKDLTASDGKTTVSYDSDNGTISIRWKVAGKFRNKELTINQSLVGHSGDILSIALSPNNQTIVSTGFDKSVRLWDVNNGISLSSENVPLENDKDDNLRESLKTELDSLEETGNTDVMVLSPKNRKLFTGGFPQDVGGVEICVWNLQAGHIDKNNKICTEDFDSSSSAAFSPNEKTVAIGRQNGEVSLWDLQKNQKISDLKAHDYRVTAIAFSPDGKTIVSGSDDGTVRLSDLQGKSIGRFFIGHKASIESVAFSTDNKTVISVSDDGDKRVWSIDWENWLKVACNRLQYHPVLKMKDPLHEGAKKTCEENVWNLNQQPGQNGEIITGETTPVPTPATPDKEAEVKPIDPKAAKEISELKGHQGSVMSVAFSFDGQTLATTGEDGTIRLWNDKVNLCLNSRGIKMQSEALTLAPMVSN